MLRQCVHQLVMTGEFDGVEVLGGDHPSGLVATSLPAAPLLSAMRTFSPLTGKTTLKGRLGGGERIATGSKAALAMTGVDGGARISRLRSG